MPQPEEFADYDGNTAWLCGNCGAEWETQHSAKHCCATCNTCSEHPCICPPAQLCEKCGYYGNECMCCPDCGQFVHQCTCKIPQQVKGGGLIPYIFPKKYMGMEGKTLSQFTCPSCAYSGYMKEDGECTNCNYHVYYQSRQWKRMAKFMKIGINAGRDLAENCADYYLLEELANVYEQEDAKIGLSLLANELAPEFATYFDLAVGGELRYAFSDGRSERCKDLPYVIHMDKRPATREQAWWQWLEWEDAVTRTEIASQYFYKGFKKVDGEWVYNHNLHGPWGEGGGVGGWRWGNIAETANLYLTGKITAVKFLDRAWNLQHNGGCALNKVYSITDELKEVLELHGSKGSFDLVDYASDTVTQLWSKRTDGLLNRVMSNIEHSARYTIAAARGTSDYDLRSVAVKNELTKFPTVVPRRSAYWKRWLTEGGG